MKYLIPTKIVGVSFQNPGGSNRQELIKNLKENDTLAIEHEKDNPYDKNSHVIKHNNNILGHINKSLAEDLVNKVNNGEKILGIKEFKITGIEKHTLGVNIIIELEKKDDWNSETKIEKE